MARPPRSTDPTTPKPETTKADTERVPRLHITMTETGDRFAWDRMRDSTSDALRKAIANDPTLHVSSTASAAAAPDLSIPPSAIGALVDAWAQITIVLAMRVQGCTHDQAAPFMLYTADEKQAVTDPLARVLQKYAPTALSKYQDEITVALLVTTITTGKLTALRDSLAFIESPADATKKTDREP